MATRRLNIAQLGVGYWGPNLVRNFYQLNEVDQLIICDIDNGRLQKIRSLYPDVETTTNPEQIIDDPTVDAIVLAIPAAMHYEYARKSLLAGKHLLVEKPLCTTSEQAEDLINLAAKKSKLLMVGHTFLYNSAVLKVKEYIDQGELGEIYYILAQRLNLGKVRNDINAMWNLAPHDISIILFWLGEFPSKVTAKGFTFLQDSIEDVVFIDTDYPSGKAAHIHVSWLHPLKTRTIIVVGSKKMLLYDDVSSDAKITIYDKGIDKTKIPRDLPDIETFGQFQLMHRIGDIYIPKIDFQEPLSFECRDFVDCILNNKSPRSNGQSGLDVVRVLEKAQMSLDG